MASPEGEAEDDYMSMVIAEKSDHIETSLAKRARIRKEAEVRAQSKSKAERAVEENEARERGLAKSIDSTSKGYQMLHKLGYKPGTRLGPHGSDVNSATLLNPLPIKVKEDRGGVGLETERKRKFCKQHEGDLDSSKFGEDDFRAGIAKKQAEKTCESLWQDAMAVLEQLEVADPVPNKTSNMGRGTTKSSESCQPAYTQIKQVTTQSRPLQKVNILYRSLLRERAQAERELRLRRRFSERSLEDSNCDAQGDVYTPTNGKHYLEEEMDEDDEELTEFEALQPAVRLQKVVTYLRKTYLYCFWCKCQYPGLEMEGCPGPTEEDHD